jgi:hypothetical protein
MKSGLMALSTFAVPTACSLDQRSPPRPGMTYSESEIPAATTFLPPWMWSAAVAPFLMNSRTGSYPLSRPM